MHFKYEEKNYAIERYPSSNNKSLRAWNAVDEYLLRYLKENNLEYHKPLIYNDRFGFLSTILSKQQPNIIINYKSQEKSLEINFKKHSIDLNTISKIRPLVIFKNFSFFFKIFSIFDSAEISSPHFKFETYKR